MDLSVFEEVEKAFTNNEHEVIHRSNTRENYQGRSRCRFETDIIFTVPYDTNFWKVTCIEIQDGSMRDQKLSDFIRVKPVQITITKWEEM